MRLFYGKGPIGQADFRLLDFDAFSFAAVR